MKDAFDPQRPSDVIFRLAAAGLGGALLGVNSERRTRAAFRILGLGLIAFAAQPLFEKRVEYAGDRRRRLSF
jgi:hypothetical protein